MLDENCDRFSDGGIFVASISAKSFGKSFLRSLGREEFFFQLLVLS